MSDDMVRSIPDLISDLSERLEIQPEQPFIAVRLVPSALHQALAEVIEQLGLTEKLVQIVLIQDDQDSIRTLKRQRDFQLRGLKLLVIGVEEVKNYL